MSTVARHFNMKSALYRAFVAPATTASARSFVSLVAPVRPVAAAAPITSPKPSHSHSHNHSHSHAFSTTALRTNKYRKEEALENMPRDHEITAKEIMIADNRGISGPKRTAHVLRQLNLQEFSLRMVANPGGQLPICRVVHIATEEERQKKLRMVQSAKLKKKSAKSIEINWNTTKHDLSYRMKQLGEFLDKGFNVHIVLSRKRRKEKPEKDHMNEVAEWVREAVSESNGILVKDQFEEATQTRRLYIEPKPKKQVPAAKQTPAEGSEQPTEQAVESAVN